MTGKPGRYSIAKRAKRFHYENFNKTFTGKAATYEEENDWMGWRFAFEGAKYWKEIVQRLKDDN